MKKTKFLNALIMTVVMCIFGCFTSFCYADFFSDAGTWYTNSQSTGNTGYNQVSDAVTGTINEISNFIEVTGTAIIIIATVFLGVKYIFGSVNDKVKAKENLVSLLIACVFFFGWSSIRGLLITGTGASQQLIIYSGGGNTDYKSAVALIFSIMSVILRLAGVVGVLFVGLKYIFSGAEGKAELKGKSIYMIIGIILVFAATVVLSSISNIITETLTV